MFVPKRYLVAGISGILVLACTGVGVFFYLFASNLQILSGHKGAVVTNGHECAKIGGDVLREGGSAVDAAIAALFCEGVAQPQSMGIGGGFLMTIYTRQDQKVVTLDARETASESYSTNMYNGKDILAREGGLSIAVPGELRGYWSAHQKFGKLAWSRLVEPTIKLCKEGHLVTQYLAKVMRSQEYKILENPSLIEIFIDPVTNRTFEEGSLIKRPVLAKTLELVAEGSPEVLYNGPLTKLFLKDVTDFGGTLTENDMKNYRPKWKNPVTAKLDNGRTLYTSPLPGSGVILSLVLNILTGFLNQTKFDTVENWHKIVESLKYGYAHRTELGDMDYVDEIDKLAKNLTSFSYADDIRRGIMLNQTSQDPIFYGATFQLVEDHGTAHISVLAPNGDAVSVTSTINQYFGARLRSTSTGIILNDEMDDFSAPNITSFYGLPPSPANFIVPNKRPMSSMCPSIVTDSSGEAVLVIGAAGGTRITSSIALVSLRTLLFGQPLKQAVDALRIHHQLFPMTVSYDMGFDDEILKGLKNIGHRMNDPMPSDGFAALTAVSRLNGVIEAAFDARRPGQISYV